MFANIGNNHHMFTRSDRRLDREKNWRLNRILLVDTIWNTEKRRQDMTTYPATWYPGKSENIKGDSSANRTAYRASSRVTPLTKSSRQNGTTAYCRANRTEVWMPSAMR